MAKIEPLLTEAEVSYLLKVPIRTLRYWQAIHKNLLGVKVGHHKRYHPKDVQEYIDSLREGKESQNGSIQTR